jgi:hypothetical protein
MPAGLWLPFLPAQSGWAAGLSGWWLAAVALATLVISIIWFWWLNGYSIFWVTLFAAIMTLIMKLLGASGVSLRITLLELVASSILIVLHRTRRDVGRNKTTST